MSFVLGAVAMMAAQVLFAASVQVQGGGPNRVPGGPGAAAEARVQGIVTAVTANSVTITTQNKVSVKVLVTAATRIERNDRLVLVAALKVGDRGEARYNPATGVASRVETVGP